MQFAGRNSQRKKATNRVAILPFRAILGTHGDEFMGHILADFGAPPAREIFEDHICDGSQIYVCFLARRFSPRELLFC